MKRLTMTVAAIALTAGGAVYAQTADETVKPTDDAAQVETNAEQNMEAAENNLEQAGEEMEQAAENTGDAIENGAEKAGDAMENAANDAGQAIDNAADKVDGAMETAEAKGERSLEEVFANDPDGLIRTRDITGGAIYAVNDELPATEEAEGTDMTAADPAATDPAAADAGTEMAATDDGGMVIQDNWENIGSIEDIILNADGSFEGVVAEVGGFLDIGDKHVHLSLSDVSLTPIDDGKYVVVTNYTKEQLMEMPDIDESPVN
ncbi:MAG: photosystem reaction center subunit H [Rhodobacteraceae bacterium]|nr:photosystem reaction center subunit H [Paracoccaceae bacterium]